MAQWSAKRQLLFFLALTFAVTGVFHWRFIFHGGLAANSHLVLPLMWTPGLIGLFCSWLFGHRFRDIGFRRVSPKQLALAYLVPALAAVLVFCLLIATGIDRIGIRSKFVEKFGSADQVLLMMLLVAPTVGVASAALRALGEEIGWRGFLHSRMVEAQVRNPYVVVGLIWALWHIPLILFSDYATSDLPYLSAALFTGVATANSVFMGWQREITGSIWPAAINHAAHNVWIQGVYPAFIKKGPLDPYFGGESGVFLAAVYLGVAVFIYRRERRSGGLALATRLSN